MSSFLWIDKNFSVGDEILASITLGSRPVVLDTGNGGTRTRNLPLSLLLAESRLRGTVPYVPSSPRTTYCSLVSSYHLPIHFSDDADNGSDEDPIVSSPLTSSPTAAAAGTTSSDLKSFVLDTGLVRASTK
jgi:hypothetical protein